MQRNYEFALDLPTSWNLKFKIFNMYLPHKKNSSSSAENNWILLFDFLITVFCPICILVDIL